MTIWIYFQNDIYNLLVHFITGIVLGINSANEKRCYYVTLYPIGRAHTKMVSVL